MRRLLLMATLLVGACSTTPPSNNKFDDPEIRRIADLQDRRASDSLQLYLTSTHEGLRAEAAMAFASVQDSMALKALYNLLRSEKSQTVRQNAAFAIGQTRGASFDSLSSFIADNDVAVDVLEGIGKTIRQSDRWKLLDVKAETGDTIRELGLARAYFHLALRRMSDSSVSVKASQLLSPNHTFQTRLAAAHYFARRQTDRADVAEPLVNAALHDTQPEVRMAAVLGLRYVVADKAVPALKTVMSSEKDVRVVANAVRTSGSFVQELTPEILAAVASPTHMIAVQASEVIRAQAGKLDVEKLRVLRLADGRPKANVLAAWLSLDASNIAVDTLIHEYESGSTYYQAHLLQAIPTTSAGQAERLIRWLTTILQKENQPPIIYTQALAALTTIEKSLPNLKRRKEIVAIYPTLVAKGDPALTGMICTAIADKKAGYENLFSDAGFLKEALAKLNPQSDVDTIDPLQAAIAVLEKREPSPRPANTYNHPIDWSLVKTIPRDQKVEITTTQGAIVMRLFVEETPGSVSNFVALIHSGYFNKTFVHRVVPNFVIQAGCNRGDGWGSVSYSIRSEFTSRRYTTGSVGMASSGKDTEGAQWFITHSPTPHLDGKYSLFGEVVSGMSAVDAIGVGDEILQIKLISK